jgi:ADP-ribosylglycohydrolase/fructose-1,6-bisphosphatase/inositol monophosphatase family enzyme
MDLRRPLEVALDAAVAAGEILRRDFHRAGGARGAVDKADADVDAERIIRARLGEAFPAWSYLGEETGRAPGEPGQPLWLVDPNDGTRDYLAGRRGSAVSIGLLAEGRPVLGVVFAFAYPDDDGDLFAWAEGCGPVRRNGRATTARLADSLGAYDVVLVSSTGDRDPEANLRCVDPARYRTVPSIAHRLALVAAGESAAAASIFAPGAWDYAGGHALLRGAGAVIVNEHGQEVSYAADGTSQTLRAFAGSAPVASGLAGRPWETVYSGPWRGDRPASLGKGRAVADAGLLSRAQGCLLGQIAGDNLGALVEFCSAAEIAARYPDGPRLLEDGGRWGILAGQPTDDSEMALALARAVLRSGIYDEGKVREAYQAWYRSEPFDVGNTTRAALLGYLMGESQANGSLMRASPLAIVAHGARAQEAAELGRRDSALTHPHPVCRDSVAAFVVAAARAVARGGDAEAAYEAALSWARSSAVPPVTEALVRAATEAPRCDEGHTGWVLIALQNAFHELLHASSVEAGVVATVRRGGDTGTNATVAGALLGAVHGRGALPGQWRNMILSCRPHPLRARRPRPMSCWPVDALELAEGLLLVGARQGTSP